MTSSPTPLARFVRSNTDDARLERQLGIVRSALGARRPSLGLWVPFAIGAAVLLLWFVKGIGSEVVAPAITNVARFETSAGERVTLADGSIVVLDPHTSATLAEVAPNRTRVVLTSGGLDCEVTKIPSRDFLVEAAGYTVRVVGTRFSVRLADKDGEALLEVRVESGRVEVRKDGSSEAARALGAGEAWSVGLGKSAAPPPTPTTAHSPEPPVEPTSEVEAVPSAEPPATTKPAESAKQLFDRAMSARAAGRIDEARKLLMQLRARHPNDPRASVAAFELARLEQDQGRDPKAASKLLSEAIQKAPAGSPLREDAEARRIEALASSGELAECRKARARFLAQYPNSIHRGRVQRVCP